MKINMQDRVDKILINIPRCRDCDVYLIYEIWAKEMKVDINKVSLLDTLSLWKNKKISHLFKSCVIYIIVSRLHLINE